MGKVNKNNLHSTAGINQPDPIQTIHTEEHIPETIALIDANYASASKEVPA